ncbi:urease accessory protein UreD [Paracidovorax citrulli]
MTADAVVADAGSLSGWHASLQLRFVERGGRTVLAQRRHLGPLVVQKTLYPEGGICHAVVIHPPAGIAGGDTLQIDVEVGAGAHAVLATPGATKWYKSLGRPARQTVRLSVEAGGRLDWLPQENIVFDDARAQLDTTLVLAPGASAIGWDAVVLGRQASGERWARGALDIVTRIGSAPRTVWLEQGRFDAASPLRQSRAGLDGMPVFGTLWAVGPGATRELAETVAASLPYTGALRAGISCLEDREHPILLLRVLGAHIEPVRRLLIDAWCALRDPIHGVAPRPLRLWAT